MFGNEFLQFYGTEMKRLIPIIFVLLWSTGFIGAKYGLPYISTGDFLSIRMIATILVFLLLIAFTQQEKLTPPQILHASITGILIHGAYLGGVFLAIDFGLPAGLTAIIVGLQPLFTALLAVLVLKEQINKIQWISLLVGLLGLYLVVSGSISHVQFTPSTLAYAFIALFGITLGTVYQKRYCQGQPLLSSACWQYCASLCVFIPIMWLEPHTPIVWHIELILSLLWLVFGLSVAAILLLLYMINQGDAAKVTSYFYLVPPVTAVEAWLLFDETLSLTTLIGMVLCVTSVFAVMSAQQWHQRKLVQSLQNK